MQQKAMKVITITDLDEESLQALKNVGCEDKPYLKFPNRWLFAADMTFEQFLEAQTLPFIIAVDDMLTLEI